MRILDMSAGKRCIWINRVYPDTVYVDLRPEMNPSLVCDTNHLPFKPEIFDLVVFDPPHKEHTSGTEMKERYGQFPLEVIKETIQGSSAEAWRVTCGDGLMAFKWNDHDAKLDSILSLMPGWEPLVAHKVSENSKRKKSTFWVLLRRRGLGYQTNTALQRVLSFKGDE